MSRGDAPDPPKGSTLKAGLEGRARQDVDGFSPIVVVIERRK